MKSYIHAVAEFMTAIRTLQEKWRMGQGHCEMESLIACGRMRVISASAFPTRSI